MQSAGFVSRAKEKLRQQDNDRDQLIASPDHYSLGPSDATFALRQQSFGFWPNVTTLRSAYGMSCPSVVCLSSVTFVRPAQRVGLLGNMFA